MEKEDFFKSEYYELLPDWLRANDTYAGNKAIKEHDIEVFKSGSNTDIFAYYLPPLAGMLSDEQSKKQYCPYLLYAVWYAAYRRTIDTYVNLLTAKNPEISVSEDVIKKATVSGTSLLDYIKELSKEVLLKNRVCVFVDAPQADVDSSNITIQQSKELELRPFLSLYKAENVIDWAEDGSYAVILEFYNEVKTNKEGFKKEVASEQFRVLDLDESGIYRQRIVRFEKDKPVIVLDKNPVLNGSTLNYIPLFPVTDKGITWKYSTPPTGDICNLNLSHFRNSANYERSLILTANPTTVIKGLLLSEQTRGDKTNPPRQLKTGASSVLRLMKDGDARYLEYTGSGVEPQKNAMKDKESLMARLGADVIEGGKEGVESVEALQLKSKSENSLLGSLSITLSSAFTKILSLFYGESSKITLNKDFNMSNMSPQFMSALGLELSSGHISWETYFHKLVEGEIIPEGVTSEEEEQKILEDQTRFRGDTQTIEGENDGNKLVENDTKLLKLLLNLTPDEIKELLEGSQTE